MSAGLRIEVKGADPVPSFSSLAIIPTLFFLATLAEPYVARNAINVRAALDRYDAQPAFISQSKGVTVAAALKKRSLVRRALTTAASIALYCVLCVCLLMGRHWSLEAFEAAYQSHASSILYGVLASYLPPFSSMLLDEHSTFVQRLLRRDDKGHMHGEVHVFRQASRRAFFRTRPWAATLLIAVRPALLGLVATQTGILLPLILMASLAWRKTLHEPSSPSFGGAVYEVLAVAGISLCPLLALVGWAAWHTTRKKDGPSQSAPVTKSDEPLAESAQAHGLFVATVTLVWAFQAFSMLFSILAPLRDFDLREEGKEASAELFESEKPSPPVNAQSKIPEPLHDAQALDSRTLVGFVPVTLSLFAPAPAPAHKYANSTNDDKDNVTNINIPPEQAVHKAKRYRLPLWSTALTTVQLSALLSLLAAFLFSETLPNPSTGSTAFLHPTTPADLFRTRAVVTRLEALGALAALAWIWALAVWCLVVGVGCVTAVSRGGSKGLRRLWVERETVWSRRCVEAT